MPKLRCHRALRPLSILVACASVLLAAFAQEASFRQHFGEYTVIYSAVRSDTLPEAMARRHGVPADPNAVLLNVTVQHNRANVPARITATATNLAQQRRNIEMRETVANDLVSYVGVVGIADREVLDFELTILPSGAERPLAIEFRETFLPQPRREDFE